MEATIDAQMRIQYINVDPPGSFYNDWTWSALTDQKIHRILSTTTLDSDIKTCFKVTT